MIFNFKGTHNRVKESVFADIQLRKGLEVDLPLLREGEPAFTTDTRKFIIGSNRGNVEVATINNSKDWFYTKNEVYTKAEVDDMLAGFAPKEFSESFVKDVATSEWALVNERYEVTIEHNKDISKENLGINFYEGDEMVSGGCTFVDNNSVKIYSDAPADIKCVIFAVNKFGPRGKIGPVGPKGADGAVGPIGPVGPVGPKGAGVKITGAVEYASNLPLVPPTNEEAYVETSTGNIYIWVDNSWVNGGRVVGPIGPRGPKGDQGVQGAPGINDWNEIPNKPSVFPPSDHNHASLYYSKEYIDTELEKKMNTSKLLKHTGSTTEIMGRIEFLPMDTHGIRYYYSLAVDYEYLRIGCSHNGTWIRFKRGLQGVEFTTNWLTCGETGDNYRIYHQGFNPKWEDILNKNIVEDKITKIEEDITELKDPKPLWKECSGEGRVDIKDSFYGTARDVVIKGKTLQNLATRVASWAGSANCNVVTTGTTTRMTARANGSGVIVYPGSGTMPLKDNTEYTILAKISSNIADSKPIQVSFYKAPTWEESLLLANTRNGILKTKLRTTTNCTKIGIGNHGNLTTGDYIELTDVIVLEGDWTNKPIPSYFEGIKSVGIENKNNILSSEQSDNIVSTGENEGNKIIVKSIGKNLFNSTSIQGKKLIANGSISLGNMVITIKANTKYFVRLYFDDGSVGALKYTALNLRDVNNNAIKDKNGNNNIETNGIFETNVDCIARTGHLYWNGNGEYANKIIKGIQFEDNTIATNYEPFVGDKKEILLPFVCGLKRVNNKRDEIRFSENKLIQRLAKKVLTREEFEKLMWGDDNQQHYVYVFAPESMNMKDHSMLLCNTRKYVSGSAQHTGGTISASTAMSFGFDRPNTLSFAERKELILKEMDNGLEIIYELKEPIVHELGGSFSLKTYNDVTHISVDSNIAPEISLKVGQDRDALILNNTLELEKTQGIVSNALDTLASKLPVWKEEKFVGALNVQDTVYEDIRDIVIKGKTLHNIAIFTNEFGNNAYKTMDTKLFKQNTKYTIFHNLKELGGYHSVSFASPYLFTSDFAKVKNGDVVVTLGEVPSISNLHIYDANHTFNGVTQAMKDGFKCVILEGDYSGQSIPFFDGIKSIGEDDKNNILLKSIGENLFDKSLNDYNNANVLGGAKQVFFKLKPNTKYTCSSNSAKPPGTAMIFMNGTISDISGVWKNHPITAQTNSDGLLYVAIRHTGYTDSQKIEDFFDGTSPIMLNEGETVIPYKKPSYDKREILLPMDGGLKSINVVEDELRYSESKIVQKIHQLLIASNSTIVREANLDSPTGYAFYIEDKSYLAIKEQTKTINCLCNCLKSLSFEDFSKKVEDNVIATGDRYGVIRVRLSKTIIPNAAKSEFVAFALENNMKISYVLNEPKTLSIDQTVPLKAQEDVTNIIQENSICGEITCRVPISFAKQSNRMKVENVRLSNELRIVNENNKLIKEIMLSMLTSNKVTKDNTDLLNKLEQITIL